MNKLFIVTITFNNYDELVKTIYSLKIIPNSHSFVVNGGECEKTKNFLVEQKIDHVTEPDNGIADAFNKGVRKFLESESEYVIFINSGDVIWNISYISKAMNILENDKKIPLVYGDILFNHHLVGLIHLSPPIQFSPAYGMPCPHQSTIYRKNTFEKVGLFDCSYEIAMDYHHICRMFKKGLVGKYVAAPPVALMDGGGVSSNKKLLTWKEFRRAQIETGIVQRRKKYFFIHTFWNWVTREKIALGVQNFLISFNLYKWPISIPAEIDFKNLPRKTFIIVMNSLDKDTALVERSLEISLSQNPPPQKIIFVDRNREKLQFKEEIASNPSLEHIHAREQSVSATINTLYIPENVGWIVFCGDDCLLMEGYTKKFLELVECRPWAKNYRWKCFWGG